MRIQKTSHLITLIVVVLSALSIACALVSLHLRKLEAEAYETRRQSLDMAVQLAEGSDRLTSAVRGYAATGDRRYYDAFLKELTVDRTRDKALERLNELGLSEAELELLSRAKLNSDQLVSLENRAIEAVAQTNLTVAIALVFGDEYRQAKESIVQPIEESRRLLAQRTSSEARALGARAATAGFIAIGMLLINASVVLSALLLFYRKRVVNPLATLNQNLIDLVARRAGAVIGFQEDSSEIGELARSMENYHTTVDEAERQRWVKASVAEIGEILQGAERAEEFGGRLLSRLVPLVGGGCGAFHLLHEADGRFHFTAGYGSKQQDAEPGFAPGEGVTGQAAVERKVIVLKDLPPGYVRIASGLGEAAPAVLVAMPIATTDRVLALVEIATFSAVTEQQRGLLDEVAATVALKLEILLRNLRTRELLEQVKATETAVRASQEQLRTLVDSIRSVIFMKDSEGRHLLVNAYYEKATGISRETIIGKTDHEVMPAEAAEKIVAQDRKVMESGEALSYEETVPGPNGQIRHYLTTKVPLINGEGRVYGICGIATDITERKRAEAALNESQERFELAVAGSGDALWEYDSRTGVNWFSARFLSILGYAEGEIPNTLDTWKQHVHPDDAEAAIAAFTEHLNADVPYDIEYRMRTKSNDCIWIRARARSLRDEHGRAYRTSGSISDITEQKKAEQEVREANFLADIALELTKCGYWHVDYSDPDYYYQGERAARIVGEEIKPDGRYHLQDEWFSRVVEADPELARQTAEKYQGALDGKYPSYDATYAYKRPCDGRIIWLHAAGSLVRDETGKVTFMYGVYQDITDLKQLEMELVSAKERAEEATQMKSMFLANMSHEIRTPMNAIIGLSHLALKTELTAKQRDYVSKVHNAGTSLLAIINDILDFSKIEAGKLDIETTDFNLDEVISSVTTVTAQKAHEKGLEFLAAVSPDIPDQLRGDPLRLGQILTNLVNNAVKFTEKGEIRLQIEQLGRTGDKVQLKFSVIDTGMGMTKEQSARLFQAFAQADSSTTRKHGGTGLGLTICRRLVELMGGQIWLESEPGVGSSFLFTVWLEVGQASNTGRMVPSQFENLSVLVVDDNAAAREILVDSLGPIAKRVDAVSSGREAIAAVKERDAEEPYDVIFMDWRMPEMDGLQAIRLIKNDGSIRKQPAIIIVTAFGREEVREEAEKLEVEGFLVKPVTKSMLVDSLVDAFTSSSGRTTAEPTGSSETESNRLKGMRILLTEDNVINQQIAVELLESVGATVTVADNGLIAVEKLTADPTAFDVVLMDVQMPVMDGYQATARIRSDERLANVPIIAMTAHATMEERQRCAAAGMIDHVSKPVDPALLFEKVGRFYKPGMNTGASASTPQPASPAPDLLPVLDDLDTTDGMSRMAGNPKLYLKLLRQFIDHQAPAPEEIREALEKKDADTAKRIAHTVKGVAGSLGAHRVQQIAAKVEDSVSAGISSPDLPALLDEFKTTMADFVARLRAQLPEPAAPAPAAGASSSPVDTARATPVVAEMIGLLRDCDPTAEECLETNRAVLQSILAPDVFNRFEEHVTGFGFDEARALLEAGAKEHDCVPGTLEG